MHPALIRKCPIGTTVYVVKKGDTLYTIAMKYNVRTEFLAYINRLSNPNDLKIGQPLCVPKRPVVPPCLNGRYYTIQYGDTLYKLAKENKISVQELQRANPFINPYNLIIGQMICIPKKPMECKDGQVYMVKEGDTYYIIATKFDVSFNALRKANPNFDLENLQIGQEICIPSSKPSVICPEDKTYIIEEGENLSSVAEKFVVSAADILKVNPNMIPSEFIPGRLICIPTEEVPV
jgi:LysM repeat protein